MLLSVPRSWNLSRAKLVLLVFLLGLLLVGAMPHYLTQKWPWKAPPPVAHLAELRAIRKVGLPIANWKTTKGAPLELGDHKWYQQAIAKGAQTATVLLLPQGGPTQQPQVEWNDIQSIQRWQRDSDKTLAIAYGWSSTNAPTNAAAFSPRIFRAWTNTHTYAVIQWYAQSNGGSAIPSRWYLADRIAQWQRQRIPWVAVSVQMPMEPLDDLRKYEAGAIALAQDIQSSLQQRIFQPAAP
jgi:cyanoexosortase B-associated protein